MLAFPLYSLYLCIVRENTIHCQRKRANYQSYMSGKWQDASSEQLIGGFGIYEIYFCFGSSRNWGYFLLRKNVIRFEAICSMCFYDLMSTSIRGNICGDNASVILFATVIIGLRGGGRRENWEWGFCAIATDIPINMFRLISATPKAIRSRLENKNIVFSRDERERENAQ